MLSYRHSFHAGNYADLLKHIVLVEILIAMGKKEKGFDYIDTHSGAGLFNLTSEHAEKLKEYESGIGLFEAKLSGGESKAPNTANGTNLFKTEEWPELRDYFEVIDWVNPSAPLRFYPGSPLIAQYFMRPQDKAWLFELHPQDFQFLEKNTIENISRLNRRESMRHQTTKPQHKRQLQVKKEDGYRGLLSLLPPQSRRGVIFIDPSYEVKTEYEQVFSTIEQAYRKFSTGIYALWYPVVEREKIITLGKKLKKSGIKNIQRFELGVSPDSDERGMTSSGMIVINPPWGLFEKMSELLPKLAKLIGEDNKKLFKVDVLVQE